MGHGRCAIAAPRLSGTLGNHVFLVFASENLNSPASMFGHLFLIFSRIDEPTLDSTAVSFAARVDHNLSSFNYLRSGLMGGFKGVLTVEPAYLKFHQYGRIQQRILYFFEMDFNRVALEKLVRHLEREQSSEFQYFFFTDNCASRIDFALRRARGLPDHSPYYVIPGDVIRDHWSAIKSVHVADPLMLQVNQDFALLDKDSGDRVIRIVKEKSDFSIPKSEFESKVLAEFYDYDFRANRNIREDHSTISGLDYEPNALTRRQMLPSSPKRRGERIMLTSLTSIRAGQEWRLSLRPTLRDFYDTPDIWARNSQLILMGADFSWATWHPVRLEAFTLMRIKSLGDNGFVVSHPWSLEAGIDRNNQENLLSPVLSFGYGLPLLSVKQSQSSVAFGLGGATSVRGMNAFFKIDFDTIFDFTDQFRMVKQFEMRFFEDERYFNGSIIWQFSVDRASFGLGPAYENSMRNFSVDARFSWRL